MKRLHQGLDYKLYQVYIWGGLPLIVIYILVSTLVFDAHNLPGPQNFFVILAPEMLWFVGILLYWWWVFLFKDNRELEELVQTHGNGYPGISSLQNWNNLHRAMSIHGGSAEELIELNRKANRPILIWYGSLNLLVLWIFGFLILGNLEIIPANRVNIWLAGVFIWIALMLIVTPLLLRWGRKTAESAYLAPLGLAITRVPGLRSDALTLMSGGQALIPDGPAIVEGERYGRLVHIETIDKYSLTAIQADMPIFQVQSNAGKLIPNQDSPKTIEEALKGLRKAKRWQGIEVLAGPQGISIRRESKGSNMWLYDLWLAEYLLGKTEHSV